MAEKPESRKRHRSHGEGSVYQRKDGRWAATISLGFVDGKRVRKTIYGATEREVRTELKKLNAELHQTGQLFDPTKMTVAEYLEEWLAQAAPKRKGSFMRIYDTAVRLHIIPELGRLPLAKLGPLHIQRLYTAKVNEGYASNTIRNMHTVLTLSMRQAVTWRLIQLSPMDGVELPQREASEMHYLTPEQVQQFLQALWSSQNKMRALFAAAVLTGLRLGELTGLTWDHVDLTGRKIQVRRNLTWDRHGREFTLGEPKTKYSIRTVPFPASLVRFLKERRHEQKQERLRAGERWAAPADLVFTYEDGRPLHQSHVRRLLVKALKEADLPQIRFHDLRHTYATLHLAQGTPPKVVSTLLGHSSTKITMDIYSHVIPGMDTTAVDRLDTLLTNAKTGTPQR